MKKEKIMVTDVYCSTGYYPSTIDYMVREMRPTEGYLYIYKGYKMYFAKVNKVWRLYDAETGARVCFMQYDKIKDFKKDIETSRYLLWENIVKHLELFKSSQFDILRKKQIKKL